MQASSADQSPLLALPREIRDEIFSYLALPQHVYTSSARPYTQSLHRTNKDPKTYIDTRVYVPIRPPTNILATCRQLREECLEYHARLLNAPIPTKITDPQPIEDTKSNKLATRAGSGLEEAAERVRDDGTTRITMEISRTTRGTMGYYVPTREALSPRFLGLLSLLCRLKKIKFTVWAGFDWWNGPRQQPIMVGRLQKARFKRTSWDQDDEVQQPGQPEESSSSQTPPPQPNPLSVAIESILQQLPLVEDVTVDVLMHAAEYYNWDLPDVKYKRLQSWLEGPICLESGKKLKSIRRRLIAGHWEIHRSATFYHQLETREEGERVFHVTEGSGDVPVEWDDVPGEPALTRSYDRAEDHSRDRPTATRTQDGPDREPEDVQYAVTQLGRF